MAGQPRARRGEEGGSRGEIDCKKEELEVPMGTTRLVPSTSTCHAPFCMLERAVSCGQAGTLATVARLARLLLLLLSLHSPRGGACTHYAQRQREGVRLR